MHGDGMKDFLKKHYLFLWGAALVLIWGSVIFAFFRLNGKLSLKDFLHYTPKNLWLAALVMLGLYCVKSVDFLISSPLLYAAAGIMFPLWAALAINTAGLLIMAIPSYLFGHRFGTPVLDWMKNRFPKLSILNTTGNGFFRTMLARMIGLQIIPVGLYFGAKRIDAGPYLAGSVVGLLPIMVCFTVMGTSASEPGSPAFLIALGVQIVCVAVSALLYAWARRHRRQPESDERKQPD